MRKKRRAIYNERLLYYHTENVMLHYNSYLSIFTAEMIIYQCKILYTEKKIEKFISLTI